MGNSSVVEPHPPYLQGQEQLGECAKKGLGTQQLQYTDVMREVPFHERAMPRSDDHDASGCGHGLWYSPPPEVGGVHHVIVGCNPEMGGVHQVIVGHIPTMCKLREITL